jgi:hypothetical protein
MHVKIYNEPLEDISPVIWNQLLRLCKRFNGRMNDNLRNFDQYRGNGDCEIFNPHVFYILGLKDRVVSWGMVYRVELMGSYTMRTRVDIYTKRSERGKGYASAIALAIAQDNKSRTKLYGAWRHTSVFSRYDMLDDYR